MITLVAAILISVALSSMHIKSIFDAHARFDSHIIEQLYFDAAIFDIEALLNVTHEKHHVDARPHQNYLLKEYVAQNGNYKYFVYDNFSGRLKFETMLHANETLWLGTYSMLMGDDLVSSIYLITNDYKVIGLAEQQSVVAAGFIRAQWDGTETGSGSARLAPDSFISTLARSTASL